MQNALSVDGAERGDRLLHAERHALEGSLGSCGINRRMSPITLAQGQRSAVDPIDPARDLVWRPCDRRCRHGGSDCRQCRRGGAVYRWAEDGELLVARDEDSPIGNHWQELAFEFELGHVPAFAE